MLRPRVYIPCVRTELLQDNGATWDLTDRLKKYQQKPVPIDSFLDFNNEDQRLTLTEYELKVLEIWDDFYQGIRKNDQVIGFPIWSEDFKDTRDKTIKLPEWKQKFVDRNIALYQRNKDFIDKWLSDNNNLQDLTPTHRKFEWQCGEKCESIWGGLIQFRTSGVRVKAPDKFSTLVAMNHQQIIGKLKRRLSIHESKLLQSFPPDFKLDDSNASLKQLGNSVNVKVVASIVKAMREQGV
jgi:DNA (cytosine-5)-methyltransferase 1